MKTRFKYNIQGMTGKLDGMVYYWHPDAGNILARRYTVPDRNPSAQRMKLIMANLQSLNPSSGYRQNFKDYLIMYNRLPVNRDKPAISWNNLFLKVMFAQTKIIPGIDLTTLTRQQIIDQNLPCRSVKAAIDWELLPVVEGYERFTELI